MGRGGARRQLYPARTLLDARPHGQDQDRRRPADPAARQLRSRRLPPEAAAGPAPDHRHRARRPRGRAGGSARWRAGDVRSAGGPGRGAGADHPKEPPSSIEPPLPGDARWLDPQTLGFFPHGPLRRSTAYEFSLARELPLAPGLRAARLEGDADRLRPPDGRGRRLPGLARVPAAAAAGHGAGLAAGVARHGGRRLRLRREAGRRRRGAAGTGDDRRRAPAARRRHRRRSAIRIWRRRWPAGGPSGWSRPSRWPAGTSYLLRCGPGLRPRDGGEGLAKAHEEAFTTYGPAGIKSIEPSGRDIAADGVPDQDRVRHPDGPGRGAQARAPAVAGRPGGGAGAGGQLPAHGVHLVGRPGAGHQLPAGDRQGAGRRLRAAHRRGTPPRLPGGRRLAAPAMAETGIYAVERASGRLPDVDPQPVAASRCAARRVPEARLAAVLTGPANYDAWWDAAVAEPVDWKQLGLARRASELRPDAGPQPLARPDPGPGRHLRRAGGGGGARASTCWSWSPARSATARARRPGASGGRWSTSPTWACWPRWATPRRWSGWCGCRPGAPVAGAAVRDPRPQGAGALLAAPATPTAWCWRRGRRS